MANKWSSNLIGTKKDEFRVLLGKILASGLTAARTFTLQDRSGTLADDTDITNAKARANHTGTQAISTVTSLQAALDAKQDLDTDLTQIAAITSSNDDVIQKKSGAWTARTPAQLKTDLSLAKSDVGLGNVDNTSDSTKNSASATLTNKDLKSSTNTIEEITTTTSSSTPTPTGGSLRNFFTVTALATNPTFAAPSGTPANGHQLLIRIKDNGTGRTLAWNAIYRSVAATLPTSTTASKTSYVGFKYNSADSKWDCIAYGQEA